MSEPIAKLMIIYGISGSGKSSVSGRLYGEWGHSAPCAMIDNDSLTAISIDPKGDKFFEYRYEAVIRLMKFHSENYQGTFKAKNFIINDVIEVKDNLVKLISKIQENFSFDIYVIQLKIQDEQDKGFGIVNIIQNEPDKYEPGLKTAKKILEKLNDGSLQKYQA